MNYKCDLKIMGVPKRAKNISKLQTKLCLEDNDVFYDTKYRKSPMWTWKHTMQMAHGDDVTHRIILQDDAIIGKNLIEFSNIMVNKHPNVIFCLYNNAKDSLMRKYMRRKYSYFRLNEVIGGVGFIVPLNIYEEMMGFYNKYFTDYDGDDGFIMSWACMNKYPVYGFWPGLVKEESKDSILNHEKHTKQRHICRNPLNHKWSDCSEIWIYDDKRQWSTWDHPRVVCEQLTEEEKRKLY